MCVIWGGRWKGTGNRFSWFTVSSFQFEGISLCNLWNSSRNRNSCKELSQPILSGLPMRNLLNIAKGFKVGLVPINSNYLKSFMQSRAIGLLLRGYGWSGDLTKLLSPIFTRPSLRDVACIRELSTVLSRPSIFVHFCTFGDLKHGLLVSLNKLMSIMDGSTESHTHRLGQGRKGS